MSEDRPIKLQSSDGVVITTSRKAVRLSGLINQLIEDLHLDEEERFGEVIPVPKVDAVTLRKILLFCEFHKNDENIPGTNDGPQQISEWDAAFLRVGEHTMNELINASNFLAVSKLLDVCCQKIANLGKGKSSEQLRVVYGIPNDWNPQEQEEKDRRDAWCNRD